MHTIGELSLSPVGLSAMTRLAPARIAGLVMGVWFLGTSVGNFIGGRVGGLYESMALPTLFGVVGAFAIVAGLILAVFVKPMSRLTETPAAGRTSLVLLLSTYELGRQPFGLASPAAWLRRAGFEVRTRDLSVERLTRGHARRRDAGRRCTCRCTPPRGWRCRSIAAIRRHRPGLPICAYGLYAPLNQRAARPRLASQAVLGPEAEADLVAMARAGAPGEPLARAGRTRRCRGCVPSRRIGQGLPPLAAYARLQRPDGRQAVVGATEATRGCKHRCRHCPIVPVYDGQFRVVPVEVVLADIRAQVAAGAEHITFGDPDFLNGPTHARRIVEALHAECPR